MATSFQHLWEHRCLLGHMKRPLKFLEKPRERERERDIYVTCVSNILGDLFCLGQGSQGSGPVLYHLDFLSLFYRTAEGDSLVVLKQPGSRPLLVIPENTGFRHFRINNNNNKLHSPDPVTTSIFTYSLCTVDYSIYVNARYEQVCTHTVQQNDECVPSGPSSSQRLCFGRVFSLVRRDSQAIKRRSDEDDSKCGTLRFISKLHNKRTTLFIARPYSGQCNSFLLPSSSVQPLGQNSPSD